MILRLPDSLRSGRFDQCAAVVRHGYFDRDVGFVMRYKSNDLCSFRRGQ